MQLLKTFSMLQQTLQMALAVVEEKNSERRKEKIVEQIFEITFANQIFMQILEK